MQSARIWRHSISRKAEKASPYPDCEARTAQQSLSLGQCRLVAFRACRSTPKKVFEDCLNPYHQSSSLRLSSRLRLFSSIALAPSLTIAFTVGSRSRLQKNWRMLSAITLKVSSLPRRSKSCPRRSFQTSNGIDGRLGFTISAFIVRPRSHAPQRRTLLIFFDAVLRSLFQDERQAGADEPFAAKNGFHCGQ